MGSDWQQYRLGKGLRVFADGKLIASSDELGKLEVTLPPAAAGAGDAREEEWETQANSP